MPSTCGAISSIAVGSGSADSVSASVTGQIASIARPGPGIVIFSVVLAHGQVLDFRPGSYVQVRLPNGNQRPLSIASAPGASCIEFHVAINSEGSFTRSVAHDLAPGARVLLSDVAGLAQLRERSARPILLVAGGTGIAPAKAMIDHLLTTGDSRPISLCWGVRAPDQLYLSRYLDACVTRHPCFRWLAAISGPSPDWNGHIGTAGSLVLATCTDLPARDIYLSGPPAMIKALAPALLNAGARPEHFFHDPA